MKARTTWIVIMLLAISLAGSTRNLCGNKCTPDAAARPKTVVACRVSDAGETGGETEMPGLSPVSLLMIPFK